jgi:hypothetical protein
MPDGSIRVIAEVQRTWTETSDSTLSASQTRSAAGTAGTVEPSEATLSIFVFDRCGDIMIIDVPLEWCEDPTDFRDRVPMDCPGEVAPSGRRTAAAATSAFCGRPTFPMTLVDSVYTDVPIWKNFWARLQLVHQWETQQSGTGPLQTTRRWKVDVFQNYIRLYSVGSKKEIWDTKTGQYVLKHLKMKSVGTSCFTNVRYKQEIGIGFGLEIPRAGGLSIGSAKTNEVGQDCKESTEEYERAPDPKKYAEPKLWNMPPYVEAECDPEHLNECELSKFRHRMDVQLTLWHPATKDSNLQGKDVLGAAIVCRPLTFAGWPPGGAAAYRAGHPHCNAEASKNGKRLKPTAYGKYVRPQ